ncbi:hypothetical protein ZWY2020_040167 [Hordeum vulgare]|nr:hypothetical protein ZWY2020_040167 [Hordeum vulgare]
MPLMLRRLAGAAAAPLRRSLRTAASRPPWAPTYRMAPLGATRAPSTGACEPFHLNHNEAPCASHLPLVTNFPDGFAMDDLAAASRDHVLFLDFVDTRHGPLGVRRFVWNPVSCQLFCLPVPSMDAALTTTPFGLLTQSDTSTFADSIGFTTRAAYSTYLIEARYGVGERDLECSYIVRKVIQYNQPHRVCPAGTRYFKVLDAPWSFKAWNDVQLSVTKGDLLEVRYKHGLWTFVRKIGPCVGRRVGLVPSRFGSGFAIPVENALPAHAVEGWVLISRHKGD